MITQLKSSRAKARGGAERVRQELEDSEKRELKLLATDREERGRVLGIGKADAGADE